MHRTYARVTVDAQSHGSGSSIGTVALIANARCVCEAGRFTSCQPRYSLGEHHFHAVIPTDLMASNNAAAVSAFIEGAPPGEVWLSYPTPPPTPPDLPQARRRCQGHAVSLRQMSESRLTMIRYQSTHDRGAQAARFRPACIQEVQ